MPIAGGARNTLGSEFNIVLVIVVDFTFMGTVITLVTNGPFEICYKMITVLRLHNPPITIQTVQYKNAIISLIKNSIWAYMKTQTL